MESRLLLEHNVNFNAKQRRIRCIGHVINLSLQAVLLASSREALLAALRATAEVSGEELMAQFSDVLDSQRQRHGENIWNRLSSEEAGQLKGVLVAEIARILFGMSSRVSRICLHCASSMT
jgi:hypothetical protein